MYIVYKMHSPYPYVYKGIIFIQAWTHRHPRMNGSSDSIWLIPGTGD